MIILNPKGVNRTVEQKKGISPRLSQLQGKRIALLDNTLGAAYFDRLEHLLKEHGRVDRIIRILKPNYPAPASPEVLERIVRESDAAIVGTGA